MRNKKQHLLSMYKSLRDLSYKEKKNKEFNQTVNLYAEVEGLDNINDGVQCIYLIEDFYIGKTTNLRNRIICHIDDSITSTKKEIDRRNLNYDKIKAIRKVLRTRKLKVKIIDYDLSTENEHIRNYRADGYPLTNKTFY